MSVRYKNKEDEEKAKRLWPIYLKTIEKIKNIKNDIILTLQKLLKTNKTNNTNKNASERREDPYPIIESGEGPMERTF